MSQEEIEAIRQDYLTSLQDLTSNSRPIISTLTIIAQENIHAAKAITKTIEEHISKCSPQNKLYGLYLLDSICKNVGKPYTIYFGLNLYMVFCDAYTLVNDSIRRKMYELFLTWKQPTANGTLLFDSVPMNKLEAFLNKAQGIKPHLPAMPQQQQQQQQLQQQQMPTGSDKSREMYRQMKAFSADIPMSQKDLLQHIESLLHLAEQRRTTDPSDENTPMQINILNQLKDQLVNKVFQADVLGMIQKQLASYTSEELDRFKREASLQQVASPKSIPTGPASVPSSQQQQQQISSPQQQTPANRKNKRQKVKNSPQSQNQQLNLTPEQLQQLQQIVSMSSQQQPQPQYNMMQQAVYPNAANTLMNNNAYMMNGIYNQQPQPQQQQQPAPNYDLLSALQGIANIQAAAAAAAAVANAVAVAPIPPKPYVTQPYGAQTGRAGLRGNHAARMYSTPIPTGPAGQTGTLPYGMGASPGMVGNGGVGTGGAGTGGGAGSNGSVNGTGKKSGDLSALLQTVELTEESLSKPRGELIGLLYSSMPKRCSTCGKRFPDTVEGRKVREAHSDWHFRVNKKLRDENWTQVRSWFLTEEEWIKYRDESETQIALIVPVAATVAGSVVGALNGTGGRTRRGGRGRGKNKIRGEGGEFANASVGGSTATGVSTGGSTMSLGPNSNASSSSSSLSGNMNSRGGKTGAPDVPSLAKLTSAQLQAKYVLVPGDKSVAAQGCGICREKFKTSFNADAEDWVWRNAVHVLGRYFHATCFAEAERGGGNDFLKRIGEGASSSSSSGQALKHDSASTAVSSAPNLPPIPTSVAVAASVTAPGSSVPETVSAPTFELPEGIDLTEILASVKRKHEETQ